MIKKFIKIVIPYTDWLFVPFVLISGLVLKIYRTLGSNRLKKSTSLLKKIGIFPIIDHYYEPLFNDKRLTKSLSDERSLPGLDFREKEQIKLLKQLKYQSEFNEFLSKEQKKPNSYAFKLENDNFESGDAEFLFNFVRHIKPKKVVEIGCGSSTKILAQALKLNKAETSIDYQHICVEPFEQPWLEHFPEITLKRQKIEEVDASIFSQLIKNDLLFIDSSHVIRPQGDVLYEYLEIIPGLNPGVYVHVHDIFTPRDYLESWIKEDVKFWNEQYLLEATLSKNDSYEITAALNFLKHKRYKDLKVVCQHLSEEREPGSFYFRSSD